MTARITPRPLKFELTTRAMVSPSANSNATVISVNLIVVQTASRKIVSCDEVAVVLQADPLRRLEREELLVGEALVDRLAERVDRDERDHRERGQEQQPREPRLPALELRRLAPAARWRVLASATESSSSGRGRMADAILPRAIGLASLA